METKAILKIFLYIFIFITSSSCGLISTFKIRDAMLEETIHQNTFKQEIPFRLEKGFIIIDVQIAKKVEYFIFDTGALTILDDDFSKEIEYEKIGNQKHKGTSGKKEVLRVVKLNKLSIGNVDFLNIVAGIADLDKISKAACINVSGIIGANSMNKSIWQIDYKKNVITLTNSKDSLNPLVNAFTTNFSATGKGTPIVRLSINGIYIGEGSIDTGSNGGIDLSDKDLVAVDSSNAFIVKHGISSGLFGEREEISKTTIISKLTLGNNFKQDNSLITFNKQLPSRLIGNKFLKDYLVTIDWKYEQIIFSSFQPSKDSIYNTFGILPNFKEGAIVVGSIIEGSSADNAGLKLNDQILQINQVDYRNITQEKYCELLQNRPWDIGDELTIRWKNGDKEFKQTLIRNNLTKDILNYSN